MTDPRWLDLDKIRPAPERFEANWRLPYRRGHDDNCALCGRPVNTEATSTRWVYLPDGWNAWPAEVEVPPEALRNTNNMGYFVIGPRCAKKLPKKYTIKW